MNTMFKLFGAVTFLFAFASSAPKPLDFNEIGRKISDFSNKALPVMKGACGMINDISITNDQLQGQTPLQLQNTPYPYFAQNPQLYMQYPQFPQPNLQNVQFSQMYPQNVGSNIQGLTTSSVSPVTSVSEAEESKQVDEIIQALLSKRSSS